MKAAPLKGAASSQIGELYRCEGFPQSKKCEVPDSRGTR